MRINSITHDNAVQCNLSQRRWNIRRDYFVSIRLNLVLNTTPGRQVMKTRASKMTNHNILILFPQAVCWVEFRWRFCEGHCGPIGQIVKRHHRRRQLCWHRHRPPLELLRPLKSVIDLKTWKHRLWDIHIGQAGVMYSTFKSDIESGGRSGEAISQLCAHLRCSRCSLGCGGCREIGESVLNEFVPRRQRRLLDWLHRLGLGGLHGLQNC